MIQTLYLIRHGQTEYSKSRRYCGWINAPLNKKGVSQARRVGKMFNGMIDGVVFTSPLQRAVASAGMIFPRLKRVEHPGLQEINFGVFQGATYEELMERYPELYPAWLQNPEGTIVPDAETYVCFQERVLKAWQSILGETPFPTVAIVAHGGVLQIIAGQIIGLAMNGWLTLPFDEASVSTFVRNGDTWKVIGMNKTMTTSAQVTSEQVCFK